MMKIKKPNNQWTLLLLRLQILVAKIKPKAIIILMLLKIIQVKDCYLSNSLPIYLNNLLLIKNNRSILKIKS